MPARLTCSRENIQNVRVMGLWHSMLSDPWFPCTSLEEAEGSPGEAGTEAAGWGLEGLPKEKTVSSVLPIQENLDK